MLQRMLKADPCTHIVLRSCESRRLDTLRHVLGGRLRRNSITCAVKPARSSCHACPSGPRRTDTCTRQKSQLAVLFRL